MPAITFNGKPYELVTLDDVTLDEAIIVWDYAHVSLDQIPDLEGMHPGVVKALIHIAVARGEPDETAKTIREMVGQLKMTELQDVFQDISVEVDELPLPTSQTRARRTQVLARLHQPLRRRPRHPSRRMVLASLARPLVRPPTQGSRSDDRRAARGLP